MGLHNMAGMSSTTTGTGTLTLGVALNGFISFASAGVVDGEVVRYTIRDGLNTEVGYGTYTSSGTTLSRTVIENSTNSGSAIDCSGDERVFLSASKSDYAVGYMPFAFMPTYPSGGTIATGLNLAANGGTLAVPIFLPAPMALSSVSLWNTNTSTARTWNWALYVHYANDELDSQNTLTRIAYGDTAASFTPVAASLRTIYAAATVRLSAGVYWLAVQNQHASNTFDIGAVAANAFAVNLAQTKTTTNPNGATLDFVTATWTKKTSAYCVRLNATVFGQAMFSEF